MILTAKLGEGLAEGLAVRPMQLPPQYSGTLHKNPQYWEGYLAESLADGVALCPLQLQYWEGYLAGSLAEGLAVRPAAGLAAGLPVAVSNAKALALLVAADEPPAQLAQCCAPDPIWRAGAR